MRKSRKNCALPKNYLSCPKYSAPIANLFVASKTFVDAANFDNKTPELLRYTPMYIQEISMRYNINIKLVIDLTNTDRFYNGAYFNQFDIQHVKIRCSGHDQPPEKEQVEHFIRVVDAFLNENDENSYILVHCTHGFNRTGYMICSFLIENYKMTVKDSVEAFGEGRAPGIYKQDYIDQLLHNNLRFEKTVYQIEAASKIEHTNELEKMHQLKLFEEDSSFLPLPNFVNMFKGKKESKFCFDYLNVESVDNFERLRVAAKMQLLTNFFKADEFVGSQPVSLSTENAHLLTSIKYQVSWKADGTRYIMYIENEKNVYMIDRDNAMFKINNLILCVGESKKFLSETVLDGEMVEDRWQNQRIPRFLVYDILIYNGQDIMSENFNLRTNLLKKIISDFKQQNNPPTFTLFSIRPKDFFDVKKTKWLTECFAKSLTHENDGLIFQPVDLPYKLGKCSELLKWKPGVLNTVDFKLILENKPKKGCVFMDSVPGYLFVGGRDECFDRINVPLNQTQYDKKIVECQLFDYGWRIMRDRPDKSFPNHVTTAISVLSSIKNHLNLSSLYRILYEN